MPSRDLWSNGSSAALRDILVASLASLLLHPRDDRPAYFSSPWMTDFPLFDNEFRQFSTLIADRAAEPRIWLGSFLGALARRRPVRVIVVQHPPSLTFANHQVFQEGRVALRFAPETYHEKGILTPLFYLEGSMNLTYSGVYVRDEKITYHAGSDEATAERISRAYLEFGRLWENLS
jgi:hypothetical protein